ncbi:hypothetical protein BDY19DRAFT_991337 [Irpex rosettiformis]|uniref:Uncharacterized protein n=1 Tax=Irpex rosettiformis TaxID=378272 RepID=A0ACB8UBF8_9APHY|nr:hypothetical protein BDY19DRAFT_991337 [Irpex rosettiformis]
MTTFPAAVTASCILQDNQHVVNIDGKTDQPPREQAFALSRPLTSSSPLARGSPAPAVPRTMSRRSFTQLLEETRRRSHCNGQLTRSVPGHWSMDHIGPTSASMLIRTPAAPPPRKSSLSSSAALTGPVTGEVETDTKDDISETIHQLEQLAQRVRAVTAETVLSVSRSPTRRGFCTVSATSSDESLSSTIKPSTPRGHRSTTALDAYVPQIVVTLPSSENIPSDSASSGSQSSSMSDSEETTEEVRWVNEYGSWGSPSSSHEDSGSDDSLESDVSSLFIAGEGEGLSDSDTICTSPPTSPRGDDKGRETFVSSTRSSPETAQNSSSSLSSTSRPTSPLSRRSRVPVIRPSKSLAFHEFTPQPFVDQCQRPTRSPSRLKQAISSPHVSAQYRGFNTSISTMPSHSPLSQYTRPSYYADSYGIQQAPSQSQSCWSISTDSVAESPGKKGVGARWTMGLKRLFGRSR